MSVKRKHGSTKARNLFYRERDRFKTPDFETGLKT